MGRGVVCQIMKESGREEKSAFHPWNLGGFSVVYTNKPGGKSLTDLVFELFGHLPWERISAKVAIGCGLLIEGFLQIQIPGIHNHNMFSRSKNPTPPNAHICAHTATMLAEACGKDERLQEGNIKFTLTLPTDRTPLLADKPHTQFTKEVSVYLSFHQIGNKLTERKAATSYGRAIFMKRLLPETTPLTSLKIRLKSLHQDNTFY